MLECGLSESLSFTGGVNEILRIFATFSYDLNNISKRRLFFFKKLLNDCELRVNGWCDVRTVLRGVNEFTSIHSTSVLTIRMALDLADLHTALLSVCEFGDNWRKEGRISFGKVNYFHARTAKPYDTLKFKNALVECDFCVADDTNKSFVNRKLFQSVCYFSEESVDGEEL